jgi:hypothetical protein
MQKSANAAVGTFSLHFLYFYLLSFFFALRFYTGRFGVELISERVQPFPFSVKMALFNMFANSD